ncbi:uncharacterized protein METZ01_LOCUS478416, partial [marine metagenome]
MPELTWKSIAFMALILVLSVGGCSSDLSEAQLAFREGTDLLQQPHYESAIRAFDKAIQLDPSFSVAYYSRGYAYGELGQHERAIQDYDQAIRLNTNYAAAYGNRGLAYALLGQYERAIQDFDKAIQLDPGHVLAYNNRGSLSG